MMGKVSSLGKSSVRVDAYPKATKRQVTRQIWFRLKSCMQYISTLKSSQNLISLSKTITYFTDFTPPLGEKKFEGELFANIQLLDGGEIYFLRYILSIYRRGVQPQD